MYLAVLGAQAPQHVSIWDWTLDSNTAPMLQCTLDSSVKRQVAKSSVDFCGTTYFYIQTFIAFHPENPRNIVTNGPEQALFWQWEYGSALTPSKPDVTQLAKSTVTFLESAFLPGTSRAVTSTAEGNIVVWQDAELKGALRGSRRLST